MVNSKHLKGGGLRTGKNKVQAVNTEKAQQTVADEQLNLNPDTNLLDTNEIKEEEIQVVQVFDTTNLGKGSIAIDGFSFEKDQRYRITDENKDIVKYLVSQGRGTIEKIRVRVSK